MASSDEVLPNLAQFIQNIIRKPKAQSTTPATQSSSASLSSTMKPPVIGIYGISGSGKTYLLNVLKDHELLKDRRIAFYDGSDVIAQFSGGLGGFYSMNEDEKLRARQAAIHAVGVQSAKEKFTAVVAGHYMFWPENGDEAPPPVWTQSDAATYTHILYLDVPTDELLKRRDKDISKKRPTMTAMQLEKWQETEKTQLRKVCYDLGIPFMVVRTNPASSFFDRVVALLLDFTHHSEQENLSRAESKLDEIVAKCAAQGAAAGVKLRRMLIIDGDRTLTAQDTSTILWDLHAKSSNVLFKKDPLKAIFGSPLGYSCAAFRQATLVYEELSAFEGCTHGKLIEQAALQTAPYGDFVNVLGKVAVQHHVGVLIVTCGLKQLWEDVVKYHHLPETIHVLAGGRLADGFVVTAKVKAALVSRLKHFHSLATMAFGDSTLDLGMLCKADRAFIIVGDMERRSKSMEKALEVVIDSGVLQGARQIVMAGGAPPRLNTKELPIAALDDLVNEIVERRDDDPLVGTTAIQAPTDPPLTDIQVHHATDKAAAKLLMTPTRDAAISGPALRAAHHRIGWYLCHEYITSIVGLEERPILHVQRHTVAGHRLRHESDTLIIALMRGGEPMAFGVNEAFPLAAFLHAKEPEQLTGKHLEGIKTVILVDSVVNTGKSVLEFIERIWELGGHGAMRIVVVAGVVQADAVEKIREICGNSGKNGKGKGKGEDKDKDMKLSLVALRLSENKFTGKGGTDTGNRLFNTTFLD